MKFYECYNLIIERTTKLTKIKNVVRLLTDYIVKNKNNIDNKKFNQYIKTNKNILNNLPKELSELRVSVMDNQPIVVNGGAGRDLKGNLVLILLISFDKNNFNQHKLYLKLLGALSHEMQHIYDILEKDVKPSGMGMLWDDIKKVEGYFLHQFEKRAFVREAYTLYKKHKHKIPFINFIRDILIEQSKDFKDKIKDKKSYNNLFRKIENAWIDDSKKYKIKNYGDLKYKPYF